MGIIVRVHTITPPGVMNNCRDWQAGPPSPPTRHKDHANENSTAAKELITKQYISMNAIGGFASDVYFSALLYEKEKKK